MCLFLSGEAPPTEEQVYFKIVRKLDRHAPYHPHVPYTKGAVVAAAGEKQFLDWGKYKSLEGGAIHVFTNPNLAQENCKILNMYQGYDVEIIRVRCRPEDFVAYGTYDEAAYSKVEVLD